MMVYRLIDFAFVVLKLLLFKVCGIIGISKNEIFNFSGPERVKQSNQGNIYMSKSKLKTPEKSVVVFEIILMSLLLRLGSNTLES